MDAGPTIIHLRHADIDKAKWDRRLDEINAPVYAYSFYLDQMAPGWEALITGDYELLMPLNANSKYGIRYLFQPFLTPQGGIFGKQLSIEQVTAFLGEIRRKYRFVEINLNVTNNFEVPGYRLSPNKNYVLDISPSYETLSQRFNDNLQRNLKKAAAAGLEYRRDIPFEEVLDAASGQLRQYTRLKPGDLPRFKSLCKSLGSRNKAQALGVYREGQLLSSAIFFFHGNRAYYILAGNHPDGKSTGASHLSLSEFIREHAGKGLLLDFVGSNIPSIAFFYECFGTTPEFYLSFKINRLPWPLNWIKR